MLAWLPQCVQDQAWYYNALHASGAATSDPPQHHPCVPLAAAQVFKHTHIYPYIASQHPMHMWQFLAGLKSASTGICVSALQPAPRCEDAATAQGTGPLGVVAQQQTGSAPRLLPKGSNGARPKPCTGAGRSPSCAMIIAALVRGVVSGTHDHAASFTPCCAMLAVLSLGLLPLCKVWAPSRSFRCAGNLRMLSEHGAPSLVAPCPQKLASDVLTLEVDSQIFQGCKSGQYNTIVKNVLLQTCPSNVKQQSQDTVMGITPTISSH